MRKVGTAVVRNYHRRRLKEFYRLNKGLWAEGGHYFALFRQPVTDWTDFEVRLRALLSKLS
ncbi:ribonuclease P protein component [bacterium]|nr:ribonuclease P protein component [bacterium]